MPVLTNKELTRLRAARSQGLLTDEQLARFNRIEQELAKTQPDQINQTDQAPVKFSGGTPVGTSVFPESRVLPEERKLVKDIFEFALPFAIPTGLGIKAASKAPQILKALNAGPKLLKAGTVASIGAAEGAGEFINQKLGITEPSKKQILATALATPVTEGALSLGKLPFKKAAKGIQKLAQGRRKPVIQAIRGQQLAIRKGRQIVDRFGKPVEETFVSRGIKYPESVKRVLGDNPSVKELFDNVDKFNDMTIDLDKTVSLAKGIKAEKKNLLKTLKADSGQILGITRDIQKTKGKMSLKQIRANLSELKALARNEKVATKRRDIQRLVKSIHEDLEEFAVKGLNDKNAIEAFLSANAASKREVIHDELGTLIDKHISKRRAGDQLQAIDAGAILKELEGKNGIVLKDMMPAEEFKDIIQTLKEINKAEPLPSASAIRSANRLSIKGLATGGRVTGGLIGGRVGAITGGETGNILKMALESKLGRETIKKLVKDGPLTLSKLGMLSYIITQSEAQPGKTTTTLSKIF